MFGDNKETEELAELLLSIFTLEELFEMNDLTEEEVLCILLRRGYIYEPERILQAEESPSEDEEET